MPKLGVNVDHVATLRQARRVDYPDPVEAALAAERAGADAITFHLREDRRHIIDADAFRLREALKIHLNQELAPTDEMVTLAVKLKPHECCLVPERRQEITTEGGLDAAGLTERLAPIVKRLKEAGIAVSLFIDPEEHQVEAAATLGADFVELHTGSYANLADRDIAAATKARDKPVLREAALAELHKLGRATVRARALNLRPNAGHGLNYLNLGPVVAIPGLQWLHIGHAIVARAVMVGMAKAVREMKILIESPPQSAMLGVSMGRRRSRARSTP